MHYLLELDWMLNLSHIIIIYNDNIKWWPKYSQYCWGDCLTRSSLMNRVILPLHTNYTLLQEASVPFWSGTAIFQAVHLGFYGSRFRMNEWREQHRRGLSCWITGHVRIDQIPVHLLRWDLVRQSPQQLFIRIMWVLKTYIFIIVYILACIDLFMIRINKIIK